MGAGQALVNDAVDQSAGLEVGGQLRHLARKFRLHLLHVFVAADAVVFLQAGLHKGRIHGRVGREDGGKIGIDADIGNDHAQILGFTTLRMMFSTLAMYSLLTSSRVPLGMRTSITNWPGSVRGK